MVEANNPKFIAVFPYSSSKKGRAATFGTDGKDGVFHRIYHDYVASADFDLDDPNHAPGEAKKTWTPYEQDLSHYPEIFHKYQENYARYDQIKAATEAENPLEEQGDEIFKREIPRDMSPWEKKYDDLMPRYTGTSCQ